MELGPFEDVRQPHLGDLRRLATERSVAAGEYLFDKGTPADKVFVIQTGLVAVEVAAPDERRLTLTLLGPEDVLGEMALAGVPRRTASVVAVRDTVVASLDATKLRAMRAAAPDVDAAVMAVLADTVRRLTAQVLEATLLSPHVRLRRILIRLNRHYDNGQINMTHEQLAAILGTGRTTVTQLLAEETANGRVATGRGHVQIIDLAALRLAAT